MRYILYNEKGRVTKKNISEGFWPKSQIMIQFRFKYKLTESITKKSGVSRKDQGAVGWIRWQ